MTLISNRDNLLVFDRVYMKGDRIETTEDRGRLLLERKAARPAISVPEGTASLPYAVRQSLETAAADAAPETTEMPNAAPQRAGRGRP